METGTETSAHTTIDRLATTFTKLAIAGRGAFIPFTVAGYPDQETSLSVMKCMIDSGASGLEIGLAFSDPIADGPIIQMATHATLASGYSVSQSFDLISEIRRYNREIPINLLVYYNMVLAPGVDNFYRQAAAAGVDSVLVADLPVEHAQEIAPQAVQQGVAPVFMISPLTSKERLKQIGVHARGYLYTVSRLGITGIDNRYDEALAELIRNAREIIGLPICVGFGISEPEQAQAVIAMGADGIITGSRIIQLIQKLGRDNLQRDLGTYVASMVDSLAGRITLSAGT